MLLPSRFVFFLFVFFRFSRVSQKIVGFSRFHSCRLNILAVQYRVQPREPVFGYFPHADTAAHVMHTGCTQIEKSSFTSCSDPSTSARFIDGCPQANNRPFYKLTALQQTYLRTYPFRGKPKHGHW